MEGMVKTQKLQIYQIVKENCTTDFRGPNPQDDVMKKTNEEQKEK